MIFLNSAIGWFSFEMPDNVIRPLAPTYNWNFRSRLLVNLFALNLCVRWQINHNFQLVPDIDIKTRNLVQKPVAMTEYPARELYTLNGLAHVKYKFPKNTELIDGPW